MSGLQNAMHGTNHIEVAGPEGAAVRQALPVTAGQTAEPITVTITK